MKIYLSFQITQTLAAKVFNTVHYKSFGVEKFHGFHGLIGNHETFPVK